MGSLFSQIQDKSVLSRQRHCSAPNVEILKQLCAVLTTLSLCLLSMYPRPTTEASEAEEFAEERRLGDFVTPPQPSLWVGGCR